MQRPVMETIDELFQAEYIDRRFTIPDMAFNRKERRKQLKIARKKERKLRKLIDLKVARRLDKTSKRESLPEWLGEPRTKRDR